MLSSLLALAFAAPVLAFFTPQLGIRGVILLSCYTGALTVILLTLTWIPSELLHLDLDYGTWIVSGNLHVSWLIGLDPLSTFIVTIITSVYTAVLVFSYYYLAADPHGARFVGYLGGFVGGIVTLVIARTFPVLFVGWEGVGITSYLLISFWYTRTAALISAIQAFLLNRIGDTFLVLAICALVSSTSSLDFGSLGVISPYLETQGISWGVILLLCAAAGKSAQLGLQAWLPNAMEAPTPVSALLHAATLVTAGAYLLLRNHELLGSAPNSILVIASLGLITSCFAGLSGLSRHDIKSVIAFSTISQVAFIVLGCGLGEFNSAIYLLFTHAFYKALLFTGAGIVIHSIGGNQDLRLIGGLGRSLPLTSAAILIASASLGAIPFTSGDFSKDILIELGGGSRLILNDALWILAGLSAGLTLFYSGRAHRLTFEGPYRGNTYILAGLHEAPIYTRAILIFLGAMSIVGGFLVSDVLTSSSGVLGAEDFTLSVLEQEVELEGDRALLVLTPLLCSLLGAQLGASGYSLGSRELTPWKVKTLSWQILKGSVDVGLNEYFVRPGLRIGWASYAFLDRGAVEVLGSFGVSNAIYQAGTQSTLPASSKLVYGSISFLALTIVLLSLNQNT